MMTEENNKLDSTHKGFAIVVKIMLIFDDIEYLFEMSLKLDELLEPKRF